MVDKSDKNKDKGKQPASSPYGDVSEMLGAWGADDAMINLEAVNREADESRAHAEERLGRAEAALRQTHNQIQGEAAQRRQDAAAAQKKLEKQNPKKDKAQAGGPEENMADENKGDDADGTAVNGGNGAEKKENNPLGLKLIADRKTMSYDEVKGKIDGLIGMEDFKLWVRSLDGGENYNRVGRLLGLFDEAREGNEEFYHIALLGNPGTGKSMSAELYAHYLKATKMQGAVFYKLTAGDLNTPFVGNATKAMKDFLKSGKDKKMKHPVTGEEFIGEPVIIHLDEAYALTKNDHGKEVLDEIVACMTEEPRRVAFIFSGYDKPMGKMLSDNPGMRSRIARNVVCHDYDDNDLLKIFKTKLPKEQIDWVISSETEEEIKAAFGQVRQVMGRHFGNGRVAQNLLAQAGRAVRERIDAELSVMKDEDIIKMDAAGKEALRDKMRTMTPADVKAAVVHQMTQAHDAEAAGDEAGLSDDEKSTSIWARIGQLENLVTEQTQVISALLSGQFRAAANDSAPQEEVPPAAAPAAPQQQPKAAGVGGAQPG